MTLRTLRHAVRRISPPWLRRGNAEKVLYILGYHLDALVDQAVAGVKTRLPGYYSEESLPYISRDRRMSRGRFETGAGFAARVLTWLDAHAHRGGAIMMLQQLHAHFAPNNFPIELLYASGRRYLMNEAGEITWDTVTWTPPGNPAKWARFWLFYHNHAFTEPDLWNESGKTWNNGQVWNSGLSAAEVADLRLIPDAWNAAHSVGRIVLLADGEQWDTYAPGAWPQQIALSIAMTDPLVPVPQDDTANVVPPEPGLPVAAEVIALAFQGIVNTLKWLGNKVKVLEDIRTEVVEFPGPTGGDPVVHTVNLAEYAVLGFATCRILVFPAGGSGAGGDTDHSGGGGGSGLPVSDTLRLDNLVNGDPDEALPLTISLGAPGAAVAAGENGNSGQDTTVVCDNGYILVGRGGNNGKISGEGGFGGNGGGSGRDTNGSTRRGGHALANGEDGVASGGLGIGDVLPGGTGTLINPCGASFLGGYNPATDKMYGGGGGGGFWKRDTGNAVNDQRMLSGIGYGAGGNGGNSDGGTGQSSQGGHRAMVVLIFEGGIIDN